MEPRMKDKKGLDPTPKSNPDPITNEPGAHPVGVAGGGTGGAMAGAAIGAAVGGPVGALVGGTVGAVAGGYAGKGAAEVVNPTEEDRYWRTEHRNRPYYKAGSDYDNTYKPAYKYGWESAISPSYSGRAFDDVEPTLQKNWSTVRGTSRAEWRDARDATRDAFDRVKTRTSAGVTNASEITRDTAKTADRKASGVWDEVKGNWHQFKGGVKEKWNELTNDEIDQMQGHREKIVGKIQEKYGKAKWNEANIESEFRGMNKR
jgi:uncharacterized protein YjbJ (UPF0337 family)